MITECFKARWAALVVLAMACAQALAQDSAGPIVFTNVHQIRALEKAKALPTNAFARLRGFTTLALRDRSGLVVQEDTNGMFALYRGPITNLAPGTVVELEGPLVRDPYAAYMSPARLKVLSCGDLPTPVRVDPFRFNEGEYFGRFTIVRGFIRDMLLRSGHLTLLLNDQSARIQVQVAVDRDFPLPREWMDAEVEVRGLCWSDTRGVNYGFLLYPPDTNFIRIRTLANTNLFDRPLVTLKSLAAARTNSTSRVRTRGVVTQSGAFGELSIQEGEIPAGVRQVQPLNRSGREADFIQHALPKLQPGDLIEVLGAPSANNRGLALVDAECRVLGRTNMPVPRVTSVDALMAGEHWGKLVCVKKARLLDWDRLSSHPFYVERLVLQADDQIFNARFASLSPVDLGLHKNSYVEVTGINRPQVGNWDQIHSIAINLRDRNDVRRVSAPAFWERREVQRTMAIVGMVVLVAGVWIAWQRVQMKRLRASESRFRALIDNSYDVTMVLDERGRAKYVSPSGERLFGNSAPDGKPLSLARVVHPDDLPRVQEAQRSVLETPGSTRTVSDYRIITRSGDVRYVEATGTNCLHVPGVHGVVVKIRDVTERKVAENEAAIRERAEEGLRLALAAEKELNELKTSFISMVSHEFRTPLEVILSSSNILDRYIERLPADKRKAQLRAIRKSVHRMNDLVEDVLFIGKFDAGCMSCAPVPVDLASVCRRIVNEVESAAQQEGSIHFECGELNSEAAADETLLSHILTNLLGNALKYSRVGSVVRFTVTRRGPDAEFVIHDQGCGIPTADRARLFTAFYRGSNVGQTPGSGLGLVIVKRCVDLHDGVIRCESEEGVGTTFTVTLPLFDGTRRFYRRTASQPEVSHA